jgi:hypothetical protein
MSTEALKADVMSRFTKRICPDCIEAQRSEFAILKLLRELGERIDATTEALRSHRQDEESGNWIRDAAIGQYRQHRPHAPRKSSERA